MKNNRITSLESELKYRGVQGEGSAENSHVSRPETPSTPAREAKIFRFFGGIFGYFSSLVIINNWIKLNLINDTMTHLARFNKFS